MFRRSRICCGLDIEYDGTILISPETSITLPALNARILDIMGQYVEDGWGGLAMADLESPRIALDIQGMATYLPGTRISNYFLGPPCGLVIFRNSYAVSSLASILAPNQGFLQWAACTQFLGF